LLTPAKIQNINKTPSVLLVEARRVGGDCTWSGCVPSKRLIACAKAAHTARTASAFGVHVGGPVRVDMAEVRDCVEDTVRAVYAAERPSTLEDAGVRVIVGRARFVDPHTMEIAEHIDGGEAIVDAPIGAPAVNGENVVVGGASPGGKFESSGSSSGHSSSSGNSSGNTSSISSNGSATSRTRTRTVRAKNFLIATGARPRTPALPGLDTVRYHTYESIFSNATLPRTLAVIGGGPIGCEIAQCYARFGAKVTIFARNPLGKECRRAREVLVRCLEAEGIEFVNERPTSVRRGRSTSNGSDNSASSGASSASSGVSSGSSGSGASGSSTATGGSTSSNGSTGSSGSFRSSVDSLATDELDSHVAAVRIGGGPSGTTHASHRPYRPAQHDAVVISTGDTDRSFDMLLVSAGREPVADGMNLEAAGVQTTRAGITIDDRCRTTQNGIYAAGDCTGAEQFTHFAAWQAFQATRNAFLPGSATGQNGVVPRATFTDPELASVGITSDDAAPQIAAGEATLETWDMSASDRAECDGHTEGFIEVVVAAKSGLVLGATCVCPRAGELINEFAIAMQHGLKFADLANAIHAYPTYSTDVQRLSARYAIEAFFASKSGKIAKQLSRFVR
jgi:pyruvate/2-oxoglutarate dehydrogenase complex dihydrolipoamide dehydrogenase (E3) component